jgi:hypothetical protein
MLFSLRQAQMPLVAPEHAIICIACPDTAAVVLVCTYGVPVILVYDLDVHMVASCCDQKLHDTVPHHCLPWHSLPPLSIPPLPQQGGSKAQRSSAMLHMHLYAMSKHVWYCAVSAGAHQ